MKAVIVSNGRLDGIDIRVLSKDADMLICADGGAKHLESTGIIPAAILGDMDSLDESIIRAYKNIGVKLIRFSIRKDKTDTELAVDYAIENGATDITLLGVTGTRLDHTLANILLLYKILKKGLKGRIIDSNNEISIIDDNSEVKRGLFTNVSLIPLTIGANIVTLEGFEYNTNRHSFKFGSSYGISNSLIDNKGMINIEDGIFIVIKSKD